MNNDQRIKRIPKRYRGIVNRMLIEADASAMSTGMAKGRQYAEQDMLANSKLLGNTLHSGLLMTFQRLGDANAQMTIQFAKLLEKFGPK